MDNAAQTAVEKVLASKGAKLRAHEMHIRRGTKGGYIVRHDLADDDGNPPTDGQRPNAEYPIQNHADLQAHLAEHMPDAQATMDAAAGDK